MSRRLDEPGAELDRKVAVRLAISEPAPFSTDEGAFERLVAALEAKGLMNSAEEHQGSWWATIWRVGPPRERVATGSGSSRALAVCRAVVNLRDETA